MQFNSNDLLVDAPADSQKLFELGQDLVVAEKEMPRRILREAAKTFKESGVNPLCVAEGFLLHERNGKAIRTPVVLCPVSYHVDKVRQLITFEVNIDDQFINPFLESYLLKQFDKKLIFESVEIETISPQLEAMGFDVYHEKRFIGNFHHHRYQVIKELEELLQKDQFSDNLLTLFGYDSDEDSAALTIPNTNLLAADTDHEAVFESINVENTVVQGPPGTGKSQSLCNMTTKAVAAGLTTLFVSEKKAALDVIVKKLSDYNLDKIAFIAGSDKIGQTFIADLKSTYLFFEKLEFESINNLEISEQLEDNLQMTLDLLNKKNLIGGISLYEFQKTCKITDEHVYNSNVPGIDDFRSRIDFVKEIYTNNASRAIGFLKPSLINSGLDKLDRVIEQTERDLKSLISHFSITTFAELAREMHKAAQCQIFENDLYKKHAGIFNPGSKDNKRFLSLFKKHARLSNMLNSRQNLNGWKLQPSEGVLLSIQKDFNKPKGFLSGRKSRKKWSELSNLDFDYADAAINDQLELVKHQNTLKDVHSKLSELGIVDPANELTLIKQTLNLYSEEEWTAILSLDQNERSRYTSHHEQLYDLYRRLNSHFEMRDDVLLSDLIGDIKKNLSFLIMHSSELVSLETSYLKCLAAYDNYEEFENAVYNSHWVDFKKRFPSFSTFSINDVSTKVEQIIAAQEHESVLFAKEILMRIKKQFDDYHKLLNTPARKLSENNKALKKRLRRGKSLLVKEFKKSRSHLSLRELYHSDAKEWIQLLKPIWLSNPTLLAKCFPMEHKLFDIAIFDESSQIPIQNALGAIERSRRIVVAGDEHQMGPMEYFQSGEQEKIDLLHQASFYWNKIPLKHHYRSLHPDLIAFSNKHFYQGQLSAYPGNNTEKPLHYHFIERGVYEDRINKAEAEELCQELRSLILAGKKNIGVVAFSEEQLQQIWKSMDNTTREAFSDNLDNNIGFFKALENVQGDECDHLLISFGFGKNPEGEFHLRFGPMNRQNGRNRLNVLLTRASKSIHFFCSVKADEFKISENESVNLLRHWLQHIENYQAVDSKKMPYGIDAEIIGDQVDLKRVHQSLGEARELVTLQRVLVSRGWKVSYS